MFIRLIARIGDFARRLRGNLALSFASVADFGLSSTAGRFRPGAVFGGLKGMDAPHGKKKLRPRSCTTANAHPGLASFVHCQGPPQGYFNARSAHSSQRAAGSGTMLAHCQILLLRMPQASQTATHLSNPINQRVQPKDAGCFAARQDVRHP